MFGKKQERAYSLNIPLKKQWYPGLIRVFGGHFSLFRRLILSLKSATDWSICRPYLLHMHRGVPCLWKKGKCQVHPIQICAVSYVWYFLDTSLLACKTVVLKIVIQSYLAIKYKTAEMSLEYQRKNISRINSFTSRTILFNT